MTELKSADRAVPAIEGNGKAPDWSEFDPTQWSASCTTEGCFPAEPFPEGARNGSLNGSAPRLDNPVEWPASFATDADAAVFAACSMPNGRKRSSGE